MLAKNKSTGLVERFKTNYAFFCEQIKVEKLETMDFCKCWILKLQILECVFISFGYAFYD